MKLYLAGPLFTSPERAFNAALAVSLQLLGHDCYLPQHHAKSYDTADDVFRACVGGIDWADAVAACVDGADPDSGTAWKCGYAHAKGKPTVVYRTDHAYPVVTHDR